MPINSCCVDHLQALCYSCSKNHVNCRFVRGSEEYLNENLEQSYVQASIAYFDLKNRVPNIDFEEIADELNRKIQKFDEIQTISKKLCNRDSDISKKLKNLRKSHDLKCNESIKDVQLIKVSLENILDGSKEESSFMGLDTTNIKDFVQKNSMEFIGQIKKLKDKGYRTLTYLKNSLPDLETGYRKYVATFSQIFYSDWFFSILGIGGPCILGETLVILNIELVLNGELVWQGKNIQLVKNKSKMIHKIAISTLNFTKNSELFIHIEMQGAKSYLFLNEVIDECVKMTNFSDTPLFPVPFLALHP